ncbi:MAG: SPFH domain-containing protein [Lachnospiraceae bacterium]|nr:SPFH domain-containing protein [Lachnospiraceae bacterium]
MALFGNKKNNGGLADVIRCDEPQYLIWKWHPAGSQFGFNKRENEIRWGSSLRVKDGEVAVFVYKQKNGVMQDFIEGPFDQIIKTANFPVLSSIIGLPFDGNSPFQAEIYFINLARLVQVKFGVPFFDVYDPRYGDFGVPVATRGTISFGISDYREFIKLHRLDTFNIDTFQMQIRDAVVRYVKDVVANAPAANDIPLVQIESKIGQINDVVELSIKERFAETFGVTVSAVDISTIEIDKGSEGYKNLMSITRDVTSATVKAEAEAKVKDIAEKQRIEAEHYEEALRIQREEAQYAQHMQSRTSNLAAYQTEKQAEVGVASANALGQMGANGAGTINMGDGGGMGFNPAAMMASMAVGGAVGQNIAGAMNGMLSGMGQTIQGGVTPPPIPTVAYNVVINGQAAGPYDESTLNQMAKAGQFTADSLVWKAGMTEWAKAGTVDELKEVLANVMPPVPSEE